MVVRAKGWLRHLAVGRVTLQYRNNSTTELMLLANANGINLYYTEAGSGEPLLLIHSTGFNADLWDKVLPLFAQDFRTIASSNPVVRYIAARKQPLPTTFI